MKIVAADRQRFRLFRSSALQPSIKDGRYIRLDFFLETRLATEAVDRFVPAV